MTYAEALRYLYSFTDFERRPRPDYSEAVYNLPRFERLLAELGGPQAGLAAIHIAGTKGKGSVAALLTAAAAAAGLRAGTYTSPHLVSPRERIALGGRPIGPELFARLIEEVGGAIERTGAVRRYRTTFEILTAAAFLAFRQAAVELAVIEVGLGGRLDSTNVIRPLVSVITPVSLDHTETLGGTVALVAAEKAGIIKPGIPVAVGLQRPEALAVIAARAAELGSPLHLAGERWPARIVRRSRTGTRIELRSPSGPALAGRLALLGDHQADNASLAATAWELAAPALGAAARFRPSMERALAEVRWPGRLQIVARGGPGRPWLLIDGAHNPASILAFRRTVEQLFPDRRLTLVTAVSASKPVAEILDLLAGLEPDEMVIPEMASPRLLPAAEIAAMAAARLPRVRRAASVGAALDDLQATRRDHRQLIAVVGSLFLAGDALAHLQPGLIDTPGT